MVKGLEVWARLPFHFGQRLPYGVLACETTGIPVFQQGKIQGKKERVQRLGEAGY